MKAFLVLFVMLLALIAAGCSGNVDTPSSDGDTSGTKIEVGDGDALQWGDGE